MALVQKSPKGSSKKSFMTIIGLAGLMVSMFLAPAILALMSVGLAPSLVAWLSDQNPMRSLRVRILFMFNMSGVIPFSVTLWMSGRGFTAALGMLGDIVTWFVMFGAAGVGVAAIWVAPQISSLVTHLILQERLRTIVKHQKKLVEDWGNDISPHIPKQPEDAVVANAAE